MKYLRFVLTGLFLLIAAGSFAGVSDTVYYEYWDVSSLSSIGGHEVTVYGEPSVIVTEKGKAVYFDGVNDALFVNNNPFGDAKEFTFEVLFKPAGGQPNIASEPRFICFWDPNDANGPRMTIEIRVTAASEWYFDGFLKTDIDDLTLIDETRIHPADQWMHAAVTYKENTFTTYVNGQQELSGTVNYTSKVFNSAGKTSIGARYNLARWYNGAIKAIKVTHAALDPSDFFSIPDTVITGGEEMISTPDDFEIYPIPAHDRLFIKNSRTGQMPLSVTVTGLTGQVVYRTVLNPEDFGTIHTIDVSYLHNGIYFLKIYYPDFCISKKVCILR